MELTIHTLTPERAADYIRFFDETPHNHGGEKCYCVTWRADEAYCDGCHWYPTEETRRAKAMAYVQNGGIEGYLAYDVERVIGWCNANGNCSLCVEYLRSFWNIAPHDPRVRVKSIFCFAVVPAYQHKGGGDRSAQPGMSGCRSGRIRLRGSLCDKLRSGQCGIAGIPRADRHVRESWICVLRYPGR